MTSESNLSGTSPSGAGTHPARLTVLSGPSGVGKGTVFGVVRERYPQVWLSVSVTTRKPRPYEVEGREYHFVDEPEFERLVRAGELLEWAHYAGYSYGTPRRPVEEKLAAGVPALLEIDVQGARQVRAAMPEAQLVFLAPPSWEELVRRLVGRGTEDDETVKRRLALVESELASEPEFDATIVNHAVDEAAAELVELLTRPITAARPRT